MDMIEILGYVASILVASSFFMKDVVKLRTINTFGAIGFVIYGLLLPTYPVAFLNTLVAGANIYYIWQALKQNKIRHATFGWFYFYKRLSFCLKYKKSCFTLIPILEIT